MRRLLLPWLCCALACGSDPEPADNSTPVPLGDGGVLDAAGQLDGSPLQRDGDTVAPDAHTVDDGAVASPARACKVQPSLAFHAQASSPNGMTFDSPFECGAAGHVLQRSGPPENRANLVILGDGYRQAELATTFNEHAQRFTQHMFSAEGEPYASYRKYINVCSLDLPSNQSGTDIPDENVQVDTALDGNGSDNTRLGLVDDRKVDAALDRLLAGTRIDPDFIAVSLNVNRWFNSGGRLMVWSGGRAGKPDVALHEAGHSFHGLADEYGGNTGRYTGAEVRELNVTIDPSGARWKDWLGYEQPGVGRIGAYEGGRYYDKGIFRPSQNSKMNQVPALHNAPCMEKIVRDLYRLVRPVDAWTNNSDELDNPCALELVLVDAARVKVEWKLDGALLAGESGARLELAAHPLAPGLHNVEARVLDETPWVRGDRAGLEQRLGWSVKVP